MAITTYQKSTDAKVVLWVTFNVTNLESRRTSVMAEKGWGDTRADAIEHATRRLHEGSDVALRVNRVTGTRRFYC